MGSFLPLVTSSTSHRPAWWQWPTVLSLDAPAVVAAWQWLFATLAGVHIRWPEVIVVSASVWLAYAADRWFEARMLPVGQIRTRRLRFYHDHTKGVALVWLVVFVVDMTVAFGWLTRREIFAGVLLLTPTLLYLLSHQLAHRDSPWRVPKEICIATLIAGGACVFVLAHATPGDRGLAGAILLFATLCFSNVTLIGVWEAEVDATQGQVTLARQFRWAPLLSRSLPWLVAAVALSWHGRGLDRLAGASVAAAAIALGIVDRIERRAGRQVARVLADLVLLTPLVPLVGRLLR